MHRISWHLHIIRKSGLLKTGEFHFSFAWVMELLVAKGQVFFENSSLPNLADILHENGK